MVVSFLRHTHTQLKKDRERGKKRVNGVDKHDRDVLSHHLIDVMSVLTLSLYRSIPSPPHPPSDEDQLRVTYHSDDSFDTFIVRYMEYG